MAKANEMPEIVVHKGKEYARRDLVKLADYPDRAILVIGTQEYVA